MAMFLQIIGHNKRLRVVKRRFQHSSQTVHAYFHEVLSAMMNMAMEIIVPTTFDPNPNISGAIGALDGTLVHAVVPISKQTMYRGRGKGQCYQNILGICDYNMMFTFVWEGWEGVTHDSRVLTDTIADPRNGFPWPPNAYTHIRGFMVPYRNVRYWLGDYRRRRDLTKEEKFNHAHAQLPENDGTTTGPWWGVEDMQYMANLCDEIATRLMH
ncbi:PREDICTED: uncharacterized protein LOC105950570 [Erythranthe guttata]|uniref:uncharacterized protein LOC105950570 n=1 Tax=Erythranthe guttata TaxID=4155 RepID=UPI00064E0A07|nr:PREDICTED: uncharacterized protein LOC105950570 [Erythranthe guttata]|eukprot:XP_012829390.1 PREDICTED: uncharacterized protein LOC105950570 [Erythranthe guttata]